MLSYSVFDFSVKIKIAHSVLLIVAKDDIIVIVNFGGEQICRNVLI